MKTIIVACIFIMIILNLIMMIINVISKKTINDREKSSPFECGFDPKSSARLPFSLRFFLIAVLFLIFDVEIALILPFFITMNWSMLIQAFSTMLLFLLVLIVGLYYEWLQGMLEWTE
uniref:NADH-ubiquinone oxidoreductase chain 3 n=1 Tax=Timema californicum TaxID=61474 RepID=Q2Q1H6_TIMCA|nr:NADH dehydrogenase subunit 3 [Timema californicum]